MKNKININVEKSTQENKRNRHHINIHEFNKYNDKKKRCSYFPIRLRLSLCKKKLTNRPNFYTISLSYQHLY